MNELIDKFKLKFTRITKNENETETISLRPEGLFKIEGMNPVYGERVCWQTNYYRLKHVMSGMYLSTDEKGSEFYMALKRDLDDSSLFMFVNVQSTTSEQSSRYVADDSYYLLRCRNESWLRLPLHQLEKSEKAVNSSVQEMVVQYGLNTCTHIDTLRVNVATSIEARQKPFLLASYPILLEALIVIGDLNCQQKAYYEAKQRLGANTVIVNYDAFESIYLKTLQGIHQLIDFLLNKSPNNIK
jgi:hypothetical protein